VPSKRIFLLIIVCVAFFGFIVALKNYKSSPVSVRSSQNVSLTTIEEVDTDKDGLKDWEEELLGFDPNNSDTNGNGILDGREKRSEKNTGALAIFQNSSQEIETTSNLTKTDKITQGLFIDYLSLKQGGGVNAGSINELVKDFEQQIFTPAFGVAFYSKKDLVEVPDSNDTLLTYANLINSLFTRYRGQLITNVAQKSIQDISSQEYTQVILLMSETYKTVAKNLIKIPVPRSLTGNHIAIANNFLRTSELLKGISASEDDYLLMLSSVNELKITREEEFNLLKTLDSYLTSRGIIFDETGHIYTLKQ